MSDVHGNRVALEAVVDDGRHAGVDEWWVLGDLVAVGVEPAATLELLTSLPRVACVSGNTDRYVVTGARPRPRRDEVLADPTLLPVLLEVEASFSWTQGFLAGSGWLDWLADLPSELRMDLPDGTRLLGVHASADADDGVGITPRVPEPDLAAMVTGHDADVVCGGHTHQPTDRRVDGVHALNVGSVSNPLTTDLRASYLLIDADRDGYRVDHRRVAYDHAEVLARIERSRHPARGYISGFQRGEFARFPATLS
jgi:predicted phosphodiesterase